MGKRPINIEAMSPYHGNEISPENMQRGYRILTPKRRVPVFDHDDKSSKNIDTLGLPRFLSVYSNIFRD